MKPEVKNLRVLPIGSNYPYYTELEILKEKENKILVQTWNGRKELFFDEEIQAWREKNGE